MKPSRLFAVVASAVLACQAGCHKPHGEGGHAHHHEHQKIVATTPLARDVTTTQQYVCQIHSQRHINVRALEGGFVDSIAVREGQDVKTGDVLFRILPTLYQARLDAEVAEVKLAQLEVNNTQRLVNDNVVSPNELALMQAKLAKAEAKVKLARAEVEFTVVKAPFDGKVDRLHEQLGSLIKEGDMLTTLSDNSVMWVYFNVPEARYLEYMAAGGSANDGQRQIELILADGKKFTHRGKIGAVEADFNNETGNIPFRADFPNPAGLLRHGQTGNVLIHKVIPNALVIPQRATFEVLDRRYVFAIGADKVVRQREIKVLHEQDDIFLVGSELAAGDQFVLEGVRQVRDGQKLDEFETVKPEEALSHQKFHAE